jgi:spermidine/putrescine transport system permease protein
MDSSRPNLAAQQAARAAAKSDVRQRWFLSLPALLLVFVAAVGPLIIVLLYSFRNKGDFGGVKSGFTTNAWRDVVLKTDIFSNKVSLADAHVSVLWRSVKLSLITTILTLIFGVPTAYFIATRKPSQRNVWLFLVTIPFWTNLLIRTFAIQEVIRKDGLINTVFLKLGFIDQPMQMLFTNFAIGLGMVYVYLPLMVLPVYSSLEKLDVRLVEAGYDLYASKRNVLRYVTLPLAKTGIIAGSILVFVPSLGAFVTPRILGGGRNLMLGNLIELQFGQGRNWPLGAALSITLTLLVFLVMLLYLRLASDRSDRSGRSRKGVRHG